MNEHLISVLRKLVLHGDIVVNVGGYLVIHDPDYDGHPQDTGSLCIDLTPEEFQAVKEAFDG